MSVQLGDPRDPTVGPRSQFRVTLPNLDKVAAGMGPAIGDRDILAQRFVGRIAIGADYPLGLSAKKIFGDRGGTRWIKEVDARVGRDGDPQPPAMANLAGQLGENHPTRLIHMPVGGRAAALEDGRV